MKTKLSFLALLILAAVLLSSGQIVQQIVSVPFPASGGNTLYYGYGCNGTSTNTCTVGGATNGWQNFSAGVAITTGSDPSGYTVKACGFNVTTANNTMICAVYDNNGSSSPISNCTATAGVTPSTGWYEDTNFSGCTLAANTTYKLAFQMNSSTAKVAADASGTGYFTASTYGTFGSSVTWSSQAESRSVYIRVISN